MKKNRLILITILKSIYLYQHFGNEILGYA